RQDIDALVRRTQRGGQLTDLLQLVEVALVRGDLTDADRPHMVERLAQAVRVTPDDRDGPTAAGQLGGGGEADARAGSGHDGGPGYGWITLSEMFHRLVLRGHRAR